MSRRTYAQMWQHIDHLKDVIRKMHDKAHERNEEINQLKAENAKLRELVRSVLVLRHDAVYKWLDATTAEVCGKSFTEQACELGIEVDEWAKF